MSCLWALVSSPFKRVQSPLSCRAPWSEGIGVTVLGNRVAASKEAARGSRGWLA